MAKPVENHEALFVEILKSYVEHNPTENIYVDDGLGFEYWELLELESFGEFENIELDDGCEGHGEDCHWVFKWKGEYYKFCYTYQSYNGSDYSDGRLYKVEPIVKPVTFYEPI